MKRLSLTLLCLLSFAAHAEWTYIATAKDGMEAHVERTTIHRSGDVVKFWVKYKFKNMEELNGIKYRVNKSKAELNCNESEWRVTYTISYTDPDGEGSPVYTENSSTPWNPIVPNSVVASMERYVCNPNNQ